MITQRYLSVVSWKDEHGVLEAHPAHRPQDKVILWPGKLPEHPPPVHRFLGQQLSLGLIEEEEYWVERASFLLRADQALLSPAEWTRILPDVAEAIEFLHGRSCFHGSIRLNRIGLREDGSPILFGIGREKGSQQQDRADFIDLWKKVTAHQLEEPFTAESLRRVAKANNSPIRLSKAPSQIEKSELLYEVIQFAHRDELDEIGSDFGPDTQTRGILDPLTDGGNTGDATGSIQSIPSMQSLHSSVFSELLSWIYQESPAWTETEKKISGEELFSSLHEQLDPNLAANGYQLSSLSSDDEDDWEHTATTDSSTQIIRRPPPPPQNSRLQILIITLLLALVGLLLWL